MDRVLPGRQPDIGSPRSKPDGGQDQQENENAEFTEHVLAKPGWVRIVGDYQACGVKATVRLPLFALPPVVGPLSRWLNTCRPVRFSGGREGFRLVRQ